MFLKLIFFTLSIINISAFELPTVEIETNNKPEIIIFKAQSILVNELPSYKLIWKTANASKVEITYLGELEASGSFIITQDEYNRGEITLRASSNTTSFVAKQTLNANSAQNKSTPMKPDAVEDDYNQQQQFYNRQYYPGGIRNPMNRRRYY